MAANGGPASWYHIVWMILYIWIHCSLWFRVMTRCWKWNRFVAVILTSVLAFYTLPTIGDMGTPGAPEHYKILGVVIHLLYTGTPIVLLLLDWKKRRARNASLLR